MTRLVFFLESYTAGGADRVARLLVENLHADVIYLLVNRSIDTRIMFATPLPKHVQVRRYNLVTPMDLGLYANRFRSNALVFGLLKAGDYLARYPLLIWSFVYFSVFIRRFRATHFFAHNGGYPGGLYCGTASMAAALILRVRCFLAVHSLPRAYTRLQWPLDWIWDRTLDQCCTMICVSKRSAALLRSIRAIKQHPICIYNGIESATLKSYRLTGELRLLHVGYFDFNKNQSMAIECLAQLVRKGVTSVKLTFVGDVMVPEAREEVGILVKKWGLESYVEFAGFREDLTSYYEENDLLLCTSKVESFPLVVLEAMRVGMPVISTNVGGVVEQIQEGKTGNLVDVDDVARMSDRILFFYENRDQIKMMGEAAYHLFQEKFTLKNMVKKYHAALGLRVESLPSADAMARD